MDDFGARQQSEDSDDTKDIQDRKQLPDNQQKEDPEETKKIKEQKQG